MTTRCRPPRSHWAERVRPDRGAARRAAPWVAGALTATLLCPPSFAQPIESSPPGAARYHQPAALWNDALAHARAGEIGEAVWHLERGVWLAPLDREMRGVRDAAQAEARRLRADAISTGRMTQGEPPALFWWRFLTGLPLDLVSGALLVSVWAAVLAILVRRRVPVGGLRDGLLVATLVCAGVAAASLAWVVGRLAVEERLQPAVVIASQPRYREAPDELARVRSNVDLYTGAVVLIQEDRPGWMRIELASGESLWVLPEVVRPVAQPTATTPR